MLKFSERQVSVLRWRLQEVRRRFAAQDLEGMLVVSGGTLSLCVGYEPTDEVFELLSAHTAATLDLSLAEATGGDLDAAHARLVAAEALVGQFTPIAAHALLGGPRKVVEEQLAPAPAPVVAPRRLPWTLPVQRQVWADTVAEA